MKPVRQPKQPEPYVFKYTIGKDIRAFGENAVVEVVCNEDKLEDAVETAYRCIDNRLFELSNRMLEATELGKDLPDDIHVKLMVIMNTIFGQAQEPKLVKREENGKAEVTQDTQEASHQEIDCSTPA